MANQIKRAPDDNFKIFREQITPGHQVVEKVDKTHSTYIPHKIYDASVAALAAGIGLTDISQTGWRYLSINANGEYEMAEIGINEELTQHQFRHVNMGNHVESFYRQYKLMNTEHEIVGTKDYEINILRVSPIYVLAIWLKGINNNHEFFIPLAPVNHKFEADRIYEYKQFLQLLQEAAKEVINHE